MTDRATGSYTHERLIAIEDSHKAMSVLLLAFMTDIKPHDYVVWDTIRRAEKIRKEAGI